METSILSKVGQIGIVVRDVDKAAEYYRFLGIGPFESHKVTYTLREQWGKPITPEAVRLKVMIAQWGSIQLELIQPVEGESIWKQFLDTKGEGVHDIGFFVDDIDKEESKLVEKELPIIYRSRYKLTDGTKGGAAYFDTSKGSGVLFELIEPVPPYAARTV